MRATRDKTLCTIHKHHKPSTSTAAAAIPIYQCCINGERQDVISARENEKKTLKTKRGFIKKNN